MSEPYSNLDLTAELDHPVRRNGEELCRGEGVAMHECEELDLDLVAISSRPVGTIASRPTKNEVSLMLEAELLRGTAIEGLRNIRLLHEAIMDNNAMKISFEMFDLDALIGERRAEYARSPHIKGRCVGGKLCCARNCSSSGTGAKEFLISNALVK